MCVYSYLKSLKHKHKLNADGHWHSILIFLLLTKSVMVPLKKAAEQNVYVIVHSTVTELNTIKAQLMVIRASFFLLIIIVLGLGAMAPTQ